MPAGAPGGIACAGAEVEGSFAPGFICYGVPVGSKAFVADALQQKAAAIAVEAQKAIEVVGLRDRQALWACLRLSIAHQFDYWLRCCYPKDVQPAARFLDEELWKVLEVVAGQPVPREGAGLGVCVPRTPVPGLEGRAFSEWVVRQPIARSGMGLRSLEEVSSVSFLAAVESVVPAFWGEQGVCPQLADVVGGESSFGELAKQDERWGVLLASKNRLGLEFRDAWEGVKAEVEQAAEWVGEELPAVFEPEAVGLGPGREAGQTFSQAVWAAREELRAKVLLQALVLHPQKQARAVTTWPQRDKLSAQWLLALPAYHTRMESELFAEAIAAQLCLPSLVCKGRVGEVVQRKKGGEVSRVDPFGDVVQAAQLPGDAFRRRHDRLKMLITRLCEWAGVGVQCEVFGLFAHLIPQAELQQGLARGRKRQGLVPDFRLKFHRERESRAGARASPGGSESVLAELKVLSCCKTRYPQGNPAKAVDRRAGELPAEYLKKARDVNQQFCGVMLEIQPYIPCRRGRFSGSRKRAGSAAGQQKAEQEAQQEAGTEGAGTHIWKRPEQEASRKRASCSRDEQDTDFFSASHSSTGRRAVSSSRGLRFSAEDLSSRAVLLIDD